MQYKIYQLKNIRETKYAFRDWECAKNHGFKLSDYNLVYASEIELDGDDIKVLEELFAIFNVNHPVDFRGHSLSMSDVVGIKRPYEKEWHLYYCDDIGWKEKYET